MSFFGARTHAFRRGGRSKGHTLMKQGWDLAGMEFSGIAVRNPLPCSYRLEDGSPCLREVSHWVQMRGYKNICSKHIEIQWAYLRDHFGIIFKETRLTIQQIELNPIKNEEALLRLLASTRCQECERVLTETEFSNHPRRCREHRIKKEKRAVNQVIEGLLNPRSPEPVLS